MSREDIGKLEKELYHYIISSGRIEPFVFLYGKEKHEGGISKIKNLSISSEDNQLELIKILESYRELINNYMNGEFDFKNLNNGGDGVLFYKIMSKDDLNKTKLISATGVETKNITDFLNSTKFKNVFFIIELNLNESGDKKIILLKSVSQNFYVKKNRFTISFYDKRQGIKFLNNKEHLLLDENFEIAAFIDNSQSFFFITDRKKFEDLYEYHAKYESAYDALKKGLDFIDWSNADATIPVLRSCYSIANFGRLDECISKLKTELASVDNNIIKKALKAKGIEYINKNGTIKIVPQNTSQLKALLKIITDGAAKTHLLNREVIGDFEELTSQP